MLIKMQKLQNLSLALLYFISLISKSLIFTDAEKIIILCRRNEFIVLVCHCKNSYHLSQ